MTRLRAGKWSSTTATHAVLNSPALARFGITRDSPQPANGRIVRDSSGELTGLVLGASQLLASARVVREYDAKDRLSALRKMVKRYNSVGITSMNDRSEGPPGFRAYQSLKAEGQLTVRSHVTYLIQAQGAPAQVRQEIERIPFVTGSGDNWLKVATLKTIVDGGILIGTAYLSEPWGEHTGIYGFSEPDYRGLLSVSRENLFEMVRTGARLGWQLTAQYHGRWGNGSAAGRLRSRGPRNTHHRAALPGDARELPQPAGDRALQKARRCLRCSTDLAPPGRSRAAEGPGRGENEAVPATA